MKPRPCSKWRLLATLPGHETINILASTRDKPTRIDTWHADMTFRERPPLGSLLRAVELPDCGGDTLFASSSAAYEGLSPRMRAHLIGLEAVHDFTRKPAYSRDGIRLREPASHDAD